MAFTPENPEFPEDLYVFVDPDKDAVYVLMYESDDGLFYRDKGQWKEITEEDNWEFDLDGLIDINVDPAFIELYDKADAEDWALSTEEVLKYESTEPEKTE
jgi:nuclear transport factor 2 (NTF2) superfamily protein